MIEISTNFVDAYNVTGVKIVTQVIVGRVSANAKGI